MALPIVAVPRASNVAMVPSLPNVVRVLVFGPRPFSRTSKDVSYAPSGVIVVTQPPDGRVNATTE